VKRLLAGVITVGLMGVLLWSGATRAPAPNPEPMGPPVTEVRSAAATPAEERVQTLMAAARMGYVGAYLGSFTGPLKQRLAREVAERGDEAFADDLRKASASRKSHAVFAAEPDGPDAASVTVEAVYPDRNERQVYRVERTDAGWLVAGVESVKSHQPKSRYGEPAAYVAPEGMPVPVPGGVTVETGDDGPADGP
jgi:hypothetical protein